MEDLSSEWEVDGGQTQQMSRVTFSRMCRDCEVAFDDDPVRCPSCDRMRPRAGWDKTRTAGDPWLGRVLDGRYVMTKHLGQGTSGRVYRAVTPHSGDVFAAKIVEETGSVFETDSTNPMSQLKNEVEILSRVRSPHVVNFYDVFDISSASVAIITEFVAGTTLGELVVDQAPFRQPRAIEIARQIAIGMSEVHELGAVHRDLKPGNILVQTLQAGDEFVHIIDFGIVYWRHQKERSAGFVGTPLFTSPEQARGREVNHLSDIYSLGAVLFTMLTGEPPFIEESSSEVLNKHAFARVPSVSDSNPDGDYSPKLVALVADMLEKAPEDRPSSMAEVADRLSDISWGIQQPPRLESPSPEGADPFDERYRETDMTVLHAGRTARVDVETGAFPEPGVTPARQPGNRRGFRTPPRAVTATGEVIYAVAGNRVRYRSHFSTDDERTIWTPDVAVTSLAMSSDELMTGHSDGTVSWIQIPDGKLVDVQRNRRLSPVSALAESKPGSLAAVGSASGRVVLAEESGSMRSWQRLPSGPPVSAVDVHEGLMAVAVGRSDGTTTLFYRYHSVWEPELVLEHAALPVHVEFADDGYLMAVYDSEGRLVVFNASNGRRVSSQQACPIEAALIFSEHQTHDCDATGPETDEEAECRWLQEW